VCVHIYIYAHDACANLLPCPSLRSEHYGIYGEEDNQDGAGVFAPTLLKAFEDVTAE